MKNKNNKDKSVNIADESALLQSQNNCEGNSRMLETILSVVEKERNEIAGLCQSLNSLGEKISLLSGKIDVLEQKVTAVESENINLSARVEKLRDQMFTLGMAEVTQNNETRHESYHNIILDEVCALRGDMDAVKSDLVKLDAIEDAKTRVCGVEAELKEVLSSLDDVKTKLELSELKKEETDTATAHESKDNLSRSLDELKKELTKIAEDFS